MKKQFLGSILALTMSTTLLAGISYANPIGTPYQPTEFVEHNGVTFGRATADYDYIVTDEEGTEKTTSVKGMPLFNGNPDDFDAYLSLIMTEIGRAGIIDLATGNETTGSYVNEAGETITYTIPAGTSTGGEALMGAAGQTELSTVMYQAQSWDKDLINSIGYLIGSENKSKQENGGYYWTSSTGTSMTDMRINPLSGRYDEGYGEDSTMASIFADLNARGYNGYGSDETGFYIMASVNTKHYSVYNAQWFRPLTNTQVGVRSFYEYNSKSANRGWTDGTFSSFMSSYGRINGVPSSASFITDWAASLDKYAVGSGTDAGADTPYTDNTTAEPGMSPANVYGEWGNGYDTVYAPNDAYKAAFMAAAGHKVSADAEVLTAAIDNNLNGITTDNLLNAAESYITIRTRTGIYDEKDENGLSKYYPFNEIASNGSETVDYTSESSQEIAIKNAQEGIVLLKNDGDVLPLGTDEKIGIYGVFAKAVNAGIYSVAVESYEGRGEEAGNNALESIELRNENTSFDLGLNKVTIQSGDSYLYIDSEDGVIQIKSTEEYEQADNKTGYYFGILDSGQGASSIYSYGNGMWMRAIISDPTTDFDAYVGSTTPLMNNAFMEESPFGAGWSFSGKSLVVVDDDATFKQRPNQGLPPMLSGYPYHLLLETTDTDGEYNIRAGARVNGVSFITGVASMIEQYYGYYLEVQDFALEDGTIIRTIGLGGAEMGGLSNSGDGLEYFANAEDKTFMTFKVTEVEPAGFESGKNVTDDDAAIIFVGQSYLGLSGEGTDRENLNIGQSQIDEALNIAKAYKEAGKKTIVVVYANYPVAVEELQNSEDIDAILFAGYGGQYGGKATAQVIFGETNPTGRLVSTWYNGIDIFPEISEYSLPQGTLGHGREENMVFDDGITMDDINDGITVDMTNADIINTGLTYKYLTNEQIEEYVTYPFGYGLGYSTFELSNLTVGEQNGEKLTVSIDVTNTGDVDTSDIVQIYMSKNGSEYGDAVALKSLAGFERVDIDAGDTITVKTEIDLTDIAVWDVNAETFAIEDGSYTLYAAHDSSLNDALEAEIDIDGVTLAEISESGEYNIWEHSFDYEDVHFDEYSKAQTAAAAADEGVRDDIYAVTAKSEGAWVAIPKVNLDEINTIAITAGAPEGISGTISLRLDSTDGEEIGQIAVSETGEATVTLAGNEDAAEKIHELGYTTTESEISASGMHNLYLVFSAEGLRAATITLK